MIFLVIMIFGLQNFTYIASNYDISSNYGVDCYLLSNKKKKRKFKQ